MSRAKAIAGRHATTALLLVLTLVYASEISSVRSLFDEGFVSTRFLPGLLVGIGLVAILVIAWRDERARAAQGAEATDAGSSRPGKSFLLFLVILGYIAIFQPLGFFLSTIALSFCCLWLFGFAAERDRGLSRAVLSLLAATIITALAYLLFSVAFGARLPQFPELG